jgi:FtsZ-binding cell division protein ZapB
MVIDIVLYVIIVGFTVFVYTKNSQYKHELEHLRASYKTLSIKYEDLERVHLKSDKENLKFHKNMDDCERYKSEYERLKKLVIKLKTAYVPNSQEPENLNIAALKAELEALKQEEAMLIEEEELLKKDNDLLLEGNEILKHENENYKEQIDELRGATENLHKYIVQINDLNEQVRGLMLKNEELTKQLQSTESKA